MTTRDATSRSWCWPFGHEWAKWVDTANVEKSVFHGGKPLKQNDGTVQERRCTRCNHLQRRIEWDR